MEKEISDALVRKTKVQQDSMVQQHLSYAYNLL